jgi:hypothetical protein
MQELDSLASMGTVLNASWIGDWPHKVGQYMLNFGAIELISYQHLAILEPSREEFNQNLDHLLSLRIDRICQLIDNSKNLTDASRLEIKSLWSRAKDLAAWRNRIAHNPVLPTWHAGSDAEHSPPDLLGIPDVKQLKFSNATNSISIEGLNQLIDASAKLGQQLNDASKLLRTAA